MYYKERIEFGTLSLSSDLTVGDDLLDELCRSAEIDRREPVRPAASHCGTGKQDQGVRWVQARIADKGVVPTPQGPYVRLLNLVIHFWPISDIPGSEES